MQILSGHVLPAVVTAADFVDGQSLTTLANTTLSVSVSPNGTVTLSGPDGGANGTLTTVDVRTCSAIVHVVDAVLLAGGGAAASSNGTAAGAADAAPAAGGDGAAFALPPAGAAPAVAPPVASGACRRSLDSALAAVLAAMLAAVLWSAQL